MLCKVTVHPIEQIFDVGHEVDSSIVCKYVGILGQQLLTYDAPLVFLTLEVRVWKQEEHLLQLTPYEVIRQVFHCIHAQNGTILKLGQTIVLSVRVLLTKGFDFVVDKVTHFQTDLHAETQRVRVHSGQCDQQTAVPASNVDKSNWSIGIVVWIQGGPVHLIGRDRIIERMVCNRIRMSSLTIIAFLWQFHVIFVGL